MAYVNTGNQRASSLTVIKYNNGVPMTSQPDAFDMKQQFTHNSVPYPVLTADEIRRLVPADYQTRATAFVAWVKTNNAATLPGLGDPAASPANIYYDGNIVVP